MAEYKPGTVAELTLHNGVTVRGFRSSDAGWRTAALGDFFYDREVTDVRPLVTLDPEDREQVERLTEEFRSTSGWSAGVKREAANAMQHALRSLTKPPKPAEPTGLGAVVEDSEGHDWHRTRDGRWVSADGLRAASGSWLTIDAVKVLSDGVTE